jgi:hypothetical protein
MCEIVAGQTWRFASRAVAFDGNEYTDGLETPGTFADALSLSVPSEASMPITIHAQAVADLDVEDVVRGATARILWWADPDGDDPIVVLDGVVEDPVYGGADEPLTATVREVPWDDRGRIPAVDAVINDDTWPNRDPQVDITDERYPIVIGAPGVSSVAGDVVGSPAFWVVVGGTDYLLIAGHPVLAASIWLNDLTGPSATTAAVTTTADGLGRQVAVCDVTAWSGLGAGDELWATWYLGGGLANPDAPGELMTGAGDVLEWMLHRSTIRVDWGRLRAAKARLNAYRIDTYIQADPERRVTPWDWIVSHLLPILPVAVRTGPAGLYLAAFDLSASVPIASLEDGRNCDRSSPVSVSGTSGVANDLALHYAPRADRDKGSRVARVSGHRPTLDTYSDAVRSALCEESVRRFGARSLELSTSVVYDDATATRVLIALAARSALPPRDVVYTVDQSLERLEPGDVVAVTDSGLGWTAKIAHVWAVRVSETTEITLRLWHRPGRDRAQTV